MNEHEQGVSDCKNNLPAKNGMSDNYYSGYGDQYTKEQQLSQGSN